ncbi:MAG: methylornithine synthase PylB [Candidatus Adiutrix sp.]|jgi:methylornithine synthase|nr:methylornithine synthase PylB [Candidatus Adiutrix sp.]
MTANLGHILEKAKNYEELTREELARIISPADDGERLEIRAAAREMRGRHSGELIFTYGFVYLSTYCRNDCRFCAYRRTNSRARRYRKDKDEVFRAAERLARQGVNLIDLTMGEDPASDEPAFIDQTAGLIEGVRGVCGLPVMISPGLASRAALTRYKKAGADWYACYQETHNPALFSRLRQGQDYGERRRAKTAALETGLLVEEGVLCGVGETAEDLADSILAMKRLGAGQVRAMGFIPPAEARGDVSGRWAGSPGPGRAQAREVDMIAALRLALPDRLIPASLDVEGLAGLPERLMAGANVVTSLVPSDMALAGVAQASLDIDNEARSVKGVRPAVEAAGLKLASAGEYRGWLNQARPAA